MKKDVEGAKHFREVIKETPKDERLQMEWSFSLSDAIDTALQKQGITKKELAERTGTSCAAVSRWLSGGHNFTLSTLARIQSVLDVQLISIG
jgi:ribosome-binding protein aMBF1 (putative translation factor)